MGSPLDLVNSEAFRKKLITRNLTPYAKAPNRPTIGTNYEYIQSDTSVQDSPDQLIDEPSFANKLYPLNQWGSEGGYQQVPDPNGLLNTKSNEGQYGFQDANIVDQALPESQKWKSINAFSNGGQAPLDSAAFFDSIDLVGPNSTGVYNNQPYPTTFNPSSYSPVSILLSSDPQGSDGLLSQDSFIARLGAKTLRKEFETRIATQIRQQTIGRANVFSVRSGTDVLNLITGRVPLIEPNWTITVPSNPIIAATDFALRLAGSTIPISPIPGSYWDTSINTKQPTTIQQLENAFKKTAVGGFFTRLLGADKTGSQIMYNNMGGGQKSSLFNNIDYNKYKPSYDRTLFDRVAGVVAGSTTNNGNFYVGSTTSDPSRVFSPGGDLPTNTYGQELQSPVYGPSELAQLYEGLGSKEIRLGANGPTYSDGGGIEGGFTWVSPKYKDNAGKKVGIGGLITNQDSDFKPSSYNTTESTNRTFREGSILDDTQRLIDSQPKGGKRLQHVGNAIDQVSKVFNDGYKELTKGSKVLTYVGAIGQEVGSEYCRVFAKDIPYLQYNDLQKQDGTVTEGRRFSYSVLDKTYNLNIAPNKQEGGQDSSNLIGTANNAYAKKYMFSIENLAWRTSNSPGFSVADLAICERGPNGGRVMWFPPYGLTFSETVSANWKGQDFLGRPEPIYTYTNTNRGGSLSWKIVVDHPSVLNVIVNKVLGNETNKTRIDSILESFFAGCRKYDLYELAKKYYTINPNDLFQIQQAISSKEMSRETLEYSVKTVQSGKDSTGGVDQVTSGSKDTTPTFNWGKYKEKGFYFDNDIPKKASSAYNFQEEYDYYKGRIVSTYSKQSNAAQTQTFFNNVVTANYDEMTALAKDIAKQIEQSDKNSPGTIQIILEASCSAPATTGYNVELSKRRLQAAQNFFQNNEFTKKYYGKVLLVKGDAIGESAQVQQFDEQTKTFKSGTAISCTDNDGKAVGGDAQAVSTEVYTTNAMACRRAVIKDILPKLNQAPKQPTAKPPTQSTSQGVLVGNVVTETYNEQVVTEQTVPRDNITKRVLRALLSECDYFETIKAETPMVFDNLRDKLKFFQPAFHSMTPEGLNTRLTFLQQCMRPGNTIPTIKGIGQQNELQYNNAVNTAFGAPPVCVLRIGDFYNTKIIPTNLAITYEQLDINPEGIGVQPMIANVTLSFHFVGGSGLKESVDKLQNALTFNYYANAEMWDDRADVTDTQTGGKDIKVFDAEFLAAIGQTVPPPTVNQTQNNNGQNNNSAIGQVLTSVIDTFETGTISYADFMSKFVTETQTYFTNVVNKNSEALSQYNNAMRQQWMVNRNYTLGNFNVAELPVVLFGKPNGIEKRTDEIFSKYQSDIDAGNDDFIKFISEKQRNFSDRLKKTVKDNFINYVKNKKGVYQSAVSKIIQDMTTIEQSYLQTLSRVNVIPYEGTSGRGTDGFQQKNGNVIIYVLSGTSDVSTSSNGAADTFVELKNDIRKVQTNISEFNKIVWANNKFNYPGDKKEYSGRLVLEVNNQGKLGPENNITTEQVFIPFSKNPLFSDNVDSYPFRRQYMITSDDVVDSKKYETFKKALIGNIIGNEAIIGKDSNYDIEKEFDAYWITKARPVFLEENNIAKAFIDNMRAEKLKDFLKYTPFEKKKRVFKFTTENGAGASEKKNQESLIKGLGAQTNLNTDPNTWNTSIGTGAYVSKAKLN